MLMKLRVVNFAILLGLVVPATRTTRCPSRKYLYTDASPSTSDVENLGAMCSEYCSDRGKTAACAERCLCDIGAYPLQDAQDEEEVAPITKRSAMASGPGTLRKILEQAYRRKQRALQGDPDRGYNRRYKVWKARLDEKKEAKMNRFRWRQEELDEKRRTAWIRAGLSKKESRPPTCEQMQTRGWFAKYMKGAGHPDWYPCVDGGRRIRRSVDAAMAMDCPSPPETLLEALRAVPQLLVAPECPRSMLEDALLSFLGEDLELVLGVLDPFLQPSADAEPAEEEARSKGEGAKDESIPGDFAEPVAISRGTGNNLSQADE